MHDIERGLAHALHADICQHNITVLYLMLGMVAVNFHVVAVFDEIALAKDCTHNSKPTAWNDVLICKLNHDIFFMVTSVIYYFMNLSIPCPSRYCTIFHLLGT